MKKMFLSLVLCGVLVATQGVLGNTIINVKAETSLTYQNEEKDYLNYVNVIVDGNYEGESGTEVNGVQEVKTIQEALNLVPADNSSEFIIYIKSGTYKEKLNVSQPNVTFIGEDALETVITYDDASGTIKRDEDGGDGTSTYGTSKSASLTIATTASNFSAINLTMENSFDEAANTSIQNRQAVAMNSTADETMFVNCRFIGNQDTLYAHTNRQYYYNCYVEGDVDFIFGNAQAVFENCEIFSVNREGITPKGYVTAPNTSADSEYGYLFLYCNLTSNITEPGTVYLGRPWHDNDTRNSSAVFKYCNMGSHIAAEGWTSMSGNLPEDNRLYEYGSTGEGAIENENRRVLSDEEAEKYTKETVLDGWDTSAEVTELSNLLSEIKSIENEEEQEEKTDTTIDSATDGNFEEAGDSTSNENSYIDEDSDISNNIDSSNEESAEKAKVETSNETEENQVAKTGAMNHIKVAGMTVIALVGVIATMKKKK